MRRMGWLTALLLSFLAGSSVSQLPCPVVTSLDSALIHLQLVGDGFFSKETSANTRAKRLELLTNYLVTKMGASRVTGLSEEEKVELAAMFATLEYSGWSNKHGWTFDDIRAALVEKAVSHHNELEPIAWFLPTVDLVSAACGEAVYSTEASNVGDNSEISGCATAGWTDTSPKVFQVPQDGVGKGCLTLCRDAGYVYALDHLGGWAPSSQATWTAPSSCQCSNSPDLVDSGSSSCLATRQVKMTGVGYPSVGFLPTSVLFNPSVMDGVDIADNQLVGIKEVVYPGGGSDESYFVAVHRYSIVLYKISLGPDGRASGLNYVQHFRWDGSSLENTNVIEEKKTNWLYNWNQGDSGTRDPSMNPPSGTNPAILQPATSFALVPTFVSLNESMITGQEITPTNLADPNNLAGLPVAGGKWQQNLVIFHAGSLMTVPGLSPVQVTTLAVTSLGLHHLRTVSSYLDDGAFYLKSPPTKNVESAAARTIGRKTFLITGSSNPELKSGAVEIFKITEQEKQLSEVASYGQLVAESVFLTEDTNVFSVAVGGFLDSQVLVLSCDGTGTGSVLKVYKMTNDNRLVLLSQMLFPGVIYDSVSYSRFQGEGAAILTSLPSGLDKAKITLLALSFKGQLSLMKTVDDATSSAEAVSHGAADEQLLVLSSVNQGLEVLKGGALEPQPQMELDSLLAQDANAMRCYLRESDGICILGTNEAKFEIVTFKPPSVPSVDNQLAQSTEWNVLEQRIGEKMADLSNTYDTLQQETKKYLGSGEPVTAKWTLGNIDGVTDLNLPSASNSITLTAVDSNGLEAAPVDFMPTLTVDIASVKTNLESWKTELEGVNIDLLKAIETTETADQTIDVLSVESVESAKFYFSGADLEVNNLQSGTNPKETFDSLLANLYTKTANQAITGLKTFNGQISVEDLITSQVVKGSDSLNPGSLLKKEGAQTIDKPQVFSGTASITTLELGALPIIDGNSASVVNEDLLVTPAQLAGDFHFKSDVFAPSITTEIKDPSMTLDQAEYDNILKKTDALAIDGTLKVTMLDSADASGRSINVKDGIVNGLSLKDINDNALLTHCLNCESKVCEVTGKITFEGDITMQQNLKASKINSIDFANYALETSFVSDGFTDSGKKTFSNRVVANTLTADTYDGLNLNQIMTKKTSQTIDGKSTFNEKVTFNEINSDDETGSVVDGTHPTVDGINFLEKFQSDLYHLDANWVINNELAAEIEFKNLAMGGASTIEFSKAVNAMNVPAVLGKVVQSTESNVQITASKTFAKAVGLEQVTNTKLIKDGSEYTTADFVNTVDTTEVGGAKTFTKAVTFEDIFLYSEAKVNNIDFAKMMFCWIDLGVNNPDNVDITNHIHFKDVSTPIIDVAKPSGCFQCPSAKFPEVTLDSSNIRANVAAFIGVSESTLSDELTVDEGITTMVQYRLSMEPNDRLKQVGTSLDDKVEGLRQLVATQYSLPLSTLDGLDAVDLLRLTCRNPLLNDLDPDFDIALLDKANDFCTGGSCIQTFKKGFKAKTLQVDDSITVSNTNPASQVFGHHINTLDDERVSLSSDQTLKGDYTIAEASIGDGVEAGTFEGKLIVKHDTVDIFSDQYKARFLDKACKTNGNSQTFTMAKKVESISATQFIEGTSGVLKVGTTAYDLPQLETDGYQLDDAESFDSITFKNEVVLKTDTTVGGTVDEVDVVALAQDIVAAGATTVVSPTLSISGTDENDLTLAGKKSFDAAPTVANVLSKSSGSSVQPRLMYRPCTRSNRYAQVFTGTVIESGVSVSTVENCHELCRSSASCVAMMFKNGMCTTFSAFAGFDTAASESDKLNSHSYFYTCMFHFAVNYGTVDEKYLGVDTSSDPPVLKLKTEKELWVERSSILMHVATGLAITGASGAMVEYDSSSSEQIVSLDVDPTTNLIKIVNSENQELTLNGDLFSWTVSGTSLNAFTENEEVFDTIEDGSLVTRVLRKSGAQDLSGGVSVAGNLALNSGTVKAMNLGSLNVNTVAQAYNYNTDQSKHVILGGYELKSPLTATTVTATTVGDRTFATFVSDTIDKASVNKETITGTKIFSTELVLNKDLTVSGNTGGRNLDAAYAATVFKDVEASLTALNTFQSDVVADTGVADATVDPEVYKDLVSEVDLSLTDSVVSYDNQGDVDLSAVFDNTILKAAAGPTTLAGDVVYKKDLTAADVTIGTLGLTGPSDTVQVPNDLVQITTGDISTTIDGKTRKFSSITADKIELNGQIYGKEASEYLTVLYKDGAQTLTGAKTLAGSTSSNADVSVSGNVNELQLASNLVFLNSDNPLVNEVSFNTLNVKKLSLESTWDNVDFDTMSSNVFELGTTQTISDKWTIKSPVEFQKKILQNGDATDGEGTINNQKVIDLKSIDSIYSNVQAVKTSAQAEANTLCKYAKDLQESYLAGQAVDSYQDIARLSSTVAPRGSKIFRLGSKTKLALISNSNLEIYDVNEATNAITKVNTVTQVGTDPLNGISLLNVFTVKPSTGTEVHIYVKRVGGIVLYRLQGDGQGLNPTIDGGYFLASSYVSELDGKFYYSSRKQDADGYYSSISTIYGDTVIVWEDTARQTKPEAATPRMEVVNAGESSDLVFVLAVPVDNFEGDMVMIVHIQPQADANSVVSYTEKWSTRTDVAGPEFVVLNNDWKLNLYSAGKFGIQVNEICLVGKKVKISVSDISGSFSNLQIHPSLIGEPSSVIAVKEDASAVLVEYKGTDGFQVRTLPLAWSSHLQSLSVMTYLESGVSKYMMSLAGDKNLAVMEGNLVYPVSKQQITCPEPEVVPLVTSIVIDVGDTSEGCLQCIQDNCGFLTKSWCPTYCQPGGPQYPSLCVTCLEEFYPCPSCVSSCDELS